MASRSNRAIAETLAALNHPNIAQIHGLEESIPVTGQAACRALVMELVEGEDLSRKLLPADGGRAPRGLPVGEALHIAKQIAEALEAAHDHGIIHRDLKPSNIRVGEDGTVKVLDFGLAKALGGPAAGGPGSHSASASSSPTLSLHATRAGIILGTAAYMSPEQARGRTVDTRTDIWAVGCVLFEMLTGKRAFPGADATDAIVAVMSKDPDWNALPGAVPPGIRRLLRRCLEKDAKQRLDSAAAVRLEIDDALAAPSVVDSPASRTPGVNRWSAWLPWAIAAGLAVTLVVVSNLPRGALRSAVSVQPPVHMLLSQQGADLDDQWTPVVGDCARWNADRVRREQHRDTPAVSPRPELRRAHADRRDRERHDSLLFSGWSADWLLRVASFRSRPSPAARR